jgi:hypothetical protein
MILLILGVLSLILAIVVWFCMRPFDCTVGDEGIHSYRESIPYKFTRVKNKALDYMRTNKINTLFFDDDEIMTNIISSVNSRLGTKFKKSDRSLWMRYYNSDTKNPYEEYHYDRQRYCR